MARKRKPTARQLFKRRSAAAKKGWATRRAREVFTGGDKDNALGEKYDFAFDAIDKLLSQQQWDKIVNAAASGDITLSLRVADFNSERLERAPSDTIKIRLKKGWNQKEAKAAIYAKLREYSKTSGTREKARDAKRMREPGEDFEDTIQDDIADVGSDVYEGSPSTVTLVSRISIVSR